MEKITTKDQLKALLKKLPKEQHPDILASPQVKRLQLPKLLLHVARGEQEEAKKLLEANADSQLLLQAGKFTDYSGRTFNCTAYEYAYWAKDTHMCRMLEQQMDEETKAEMLIRCEAMERDGLDYTQNGEEKNSAHFDFMPLITALQIYVNEYMNWMNVGKAQRDVPAHVAHEYCRLDRIFFPLSEFNEPSLPRNLTFYNRETERNESWFPFGVSSGLGFDFSLIQRQPLVGMRQQAERELALWNLGAVRSLDKVRTADLTQSLENLKPLAQVAGLGSLNA
ncbi:MAG: hypothetical protein Q8M03_04160 [Legionella sp.]|nr:hypothetical protein [Legionella sp.]